MYHPNQDTFESERLCYYLLYWNKRQWQKLFRVSWTLKLNGDACVYSTAWIQPKYSWAILKPASLADTTFSTTNNKERGKGERTILDTLKNNVDISYRFFLKGGFSALNEYIMHTYPNILKFSSSVSPKSLPQQPPSLHSRCSSSHRTILSELFFTFSFSSISPQILFPSASPSLPFKMCKEVGGEGDCEHACIKSLCVFITPFRFSSY